MSVSDALLSVISFQMLVFLLWQVREAFYTPDPVA
jgi:hypothetical protein